MATSSASGLSRALLSFAFGISILHPRQYIIRGSWQWMRLWKRSKLVNLLHLQVFIDTDCITRQNSLTNCIIRLYKNCAGLVPDLRQYAKVGLRPTTFKLGLRSIYYCSVPEILSYIVHPHPPRSYLVNRKREHPPPPPPPPLLRSYLDTRLSLHIPQEKMFVLLPWSSRVVPYDLM